MIRIAILFIPFTVLLTGLSAQNMRSIYLDAGVSLYTPLQRQEHVIMNHMADYQLYRYILAGPALKIGFEQRVAGKSDIWLSVPFVLGYRSQVEKQVLNGAYYGDFVSFKGQETRTYTSHVTGMSAGAKLNYLKGRSTWGLALFCHNELYLAQTYAYKSVPDDGGQTYRSRTFSWGSPDDFNVNLSLQATWLYRFSEHWSAGLSIDCYGYNLSQAFDRQSKYRQLFNISSATGTAKGGLFNPAIRISRQF